MWPEGQWEARIWSCNLRANERPQKRSHGKGTSNTQTDKQTLWLLDQLGPEGRVGEKALYACLKIVRVTEFEQKATYINIESLMNQKKDLLKQKKQRVQFGSVDLDDKIEDIDQLISEECSKAG